MDFLYQQFVAGKQKAVAAWLSAALVAYLARHGIALPGDAGDVISALILGLIALVAVYVKKNQ